MPKDTMDFGGGGGDDLQRLPRTPLPHYTDFLIPLLAMASALMLGFAMPALIEAEGLIDYLKCALVGVTGGLLSYGISRLALEKGTMQAAIGTRGAATLSIGSMQTIGAALFAATFTGFTLERTDQLQLEAYAQKLGAYADTGVQDAGAASRIYPALQTTADDLAQKAACEDAFSCVSGRGNGGKGDIYRVLFDQSQRAAALQGQAVAAQEGQRAALATLGALLSRFQEIAGDSARSMKDRRQALHALDVEIAQAVRALDEAAPTALVTAYADELARGVSLPGDPGSARRVNAILGAHAAQLRAVLGSDGVETTNRPAFPPRTGVADTFSYLGYFLPLALVIAMIEAGFPTLLWLYTYFGLMARLKQAEGKPTPPARKPRTPKRT